MDNPDFTDPLVQPGTHFRGFRIDQLTGLLQSLFFTGRAQLGFGNGQNRQEHNQNAGQKRPAEFCPQCHRIPLFPWLKRMSILVF